MHAKYWATESESKTVNVTLHPVMSALMSVASTSTACEINLPNSDTIQEYPLLMVVLFFVLGVLRIRMVLQFRSIQNVANRLIDRREHRDANNDSPYRKEDPKRN